MQQIRPLAASGLQHSRESSSGGSRATLDYFTIDVGLPGSWTQSGASLTSVSGFVSVCVSRILELYRDGHNANVVLIGHGSGAHVARMVAMSLRTPAHVQVVISVLPPPAGLMVDRVMEQFHHNITQESLSRSLRTAHMSVVTVGAESPGSDVTMLVSADSVWCQDMVTRINRALINIVSGVTKHISVDTVMRNQVLSYNIVDGGHGKPPVYNDDERLVSLDKAGYWSDILKKQFTVSKGNVTCDHFTSVRIHGQQGSVLVETTHLTRDWIYGCVSTEVVKYTRVCSQAERLSSSTGLVPGSVTGERRVALLELEDLLETHGYSHLIIHTPAHTPPSIINIDIHTPHERQLVYHPPVWILALLGQTILEKTSPASVYYRVKVEDVDSPWQIYSLTITTHQCSDQPKLAGAVVSNTGDYVLLNSTQDTHYIPVNNHQTEFQFFFSPECDYSISISLNIHDIINKINNVLLPTTLPCNIIIIFTLLTAINIDSSSNDSLMSSLSSISPFIILVSSRLVFYILAMSNINSDHYVMETLGLNSGATPLLSLLLAHGCSYLPAALLWFTIQGTGHLLKNSAQSFQAHFESSSLSMYPPLLSLTMIIVAAVSHGTLSLMVSFILYIVHISLQYGHYLTRSDARILSSIKLHACLALLWLCQLYLQCPALVSWSQGQSSTDPSSLIHAVCILSSTALLWQPNSRLVQIDQKYSQGLFYALHVLAALMTPFATISIYRASFAISSIFIVISSFILVSIDWSRTSVSGDDVSQTESHDQDVPATKKRGTYKVITSYLETGEGEEGLDWELCMTEEGDSAILQYPYYICVSNRLASLPRDFVHDLLEVGRLALGFTSLAVSSLWDQPRKPRIEVTVATPDYDYLPDNHPLRKIHLQKEEPQEEISKLVGITENLKKVVMSVVQFHYNFYFDIFTTLKIGFGFILYLISSFPMDVFLYFHGSGSDESRSPLETLKTVIHLIPATAAGIIAAISRSVESVNELVRNATRQNIVEKKSSKSPSPTEKKPTISKTVLKENFPRKPSLPCSSTEQKKDIEQKVYTASPVRKSESKSPPIDVIPAKSIEAFKSEVKIQEEILKIGKDKARELFSEPVVVSGPWIPEKKESIEVKVKDEPIIPGYKESRQSKLPMKTEARSEDFKSGVIERPTERPKLEERVTAFDETPLPTSSIFERDSSNKGFDLKAKVKTSIHSSIYNIHAACEDEDDEEHIEELEKLRDVSPEPEKEESARYRRSDLMRDIKHAPSTSASSRPPLPRGQYHRSGDFADMLSEAPRESPDLKTKFSVKDEIAQLRQTVREELINVRAAEPDEAIGVSGESGVDDDYERIHIMKFDSDTRRNRGSDQTQLTRRKSVKNRRFSKSPPRAQSPGFINKEESSDEDIKSWEMIAKEDIDDESSVRSSGSIKRSTSNIRRRNRSSTRGEDRSSSGIKQRSSSLQPDQRSSSNTEFCDQLAKRLSGELGKNSMQDIQVKRRDSFLDISIPLDDSKSAASMESLMFFSKTISDTANTFQQSLNETAEKFSKTLDQTAATLKKALSEKNLAHASTQEISETLHETADILSKTSEILSQTAKVRQIILFYTCNNFSTVDISPNSRSGSNRRTCKTFKNSFFYQCSKLLSFRERRINKTISTSTFC